MNSSEWITFQTYPSRIVAEMAKSRLESEGISVQILVDDAGGIYPSLGLLSGARLLVQKKDLEKSHDILESP